MALSCYSSNLKMARVSINNFLFLSRRSYALVSAESGAPIGVPAALLNTDQESGRFKADRSQKETKKNFWMRDPATGNWLPENHMDDMDAAELREKHLPKKYLISGA